MKQRAKTTNTQVQLTQAVANTLPYFDQIKNIDTSESDAIRFFWRSTAFRVAGTSGFPHVCEIRNGMQIGSDVALLFEELLKRSLSK